MLDKIGTPSYMAPELWMEDDKKYDSSVDMWALGVVCYMLLSGTAPSTTRTATEKRRICHDPLQFPSPGPWDHVSDAAKDFCNKLMQKNPKDRMPAWRRCTTHKQQSTLHSGEDAAHEMQRHQDIVDSLQAFSEADDLKRVALEVIAFSTPPGKLEELRHMFVNMDTDDSGTLSIRALPLTLPLPRPLNPTPTPTLTLTLTLTRHALHRGVQESDGTPPRDTDGAGREDVPRHGHHALGRGRLHRVHRGRQRQEGLGGEALI